MNDAREVLTIKCPRCDNVASFGEFASSNPNDTQKSVALHILCKLGWQLTWAGWQCPNHKPSPLFVDARQGSQP